MKKPLHFSSLFLSLFFTGTLLAQADRFAYVVTDVNKEGANWSFLRKVDLQSGNYSDVLLSGNDAKKMAFDAGSKKQLTKPFTDERFGNIANAAFGTGVAAIAYDKKNERLFYTPMFVNQLRYVDLKSMNSFFVDGSDLDGMKQKQNDQSNIMTRMTMGLDGNGYILSNDGNHLVQFSSGKKVNITRLGALEDAPANTVSIHNAGISYGGDMIADDDGNLFVFSARNHVFKVNIETKVAAYLGVVTDLPAQFTTNGAAVNDKNEIILASAIGTSSLYAVDFKTLKATPVKSDLIWRSSDLGNSNLLATRLVVPPAKLISTLNEKPDGRVQIYPNPVINNQFALQFNQLEGNYTVQVTDAMGRQQKAQTIVNVKGKGQIESVQLPAATLKGVYLVKVLDQTNKTVFTRKIVVQ